MLYAPTTHQNEHEHELILNYNAKTPQQSNRNYKCKNLMCGRQRYAYIYENTYTSSYLCGTFRLRVFLV